MWANSKPPNLAQHERNNTGGSPLLANTAEWMAGSFWPAAVGGFDGFVLMRR